MGIIELKKVNNSDARNLFDWANDPATRKASFNSEPIIWENHIKWLETKLADENCFFYIAYTQDQACGSIRLDYEEGANAFYISYSISPAYRGRGLGAEILGEAEKKMKCDYGECVFIGEVKNDNPASIKCFEKLEYAVIENDNDKIVFRKEIV